MRKAAADLVALVGCSVRSVLRAARKPGQGPPLRLRLWAQAAPAGCAPALRSRSYSTELPGRSSTEETDAIYQPVFNIDVLVSLLRQENAKDICVIKLPMELKYANYFIIVSGTSARHLQAMAQYVIKVHKHLKTGENDCVTIEGKDTDDWKCIDFGTMVVHFMLPETRELYELEKLWTLRSYDDQFLKIAPEVLPLDFIYEPTDDFEQK